jgi:predicted TPR repeat methyltransferase
MVLRARKASDSTVAISSIRKSLGTGAPELPDAQQALTIIDKLARGNAGFAALLARGAPAGDALARFGLEFFGRGQFAEAGAAFRWALALAPGDAVLWTNYGTALDRTGSFAEAAACLERSLELAPQQPDTWVLLGLVRKKTGDLEGCEVAYRESLAQQPDSSTAWQCLGLLKNERRDYAGAIECFANALKLDPANAATTANLGKLHYELGRLREADDAYAQAVNLEGNNLHYRQMARKVRFLRAVLEGETVDGALAAYEAAAAASGAEKKGEKDRRELLETAFGQLSGFGHLEAAKRVGEKYLALWPDSTAVRYLMSAIDGSAKLDRSPSEYIVEHFDAFASRFDAKLVEVLGYDLPGKICAAVRQLTPAGHRYEALDAGCGTGLCGPLLRPLCRQLVGVDLSPKMLERAGQHGVYDRLVCGELTDFLERSPGQFDLLVAADVLIYIGDLTEVFEAAAGALRGGGMFAFSTEPFAGESYRLQPSGRFAHATEYVRSVARENFVERVFEETTIRLEAGARVAGNLFVFQCKS